MDILFPIDCIFCKKPGVWLCEQCTRKIKLLPFQVCPYCEKIESPAGEVCPDCRIKFLRKDQLVPLDNLIVSSVYDKSGVSRLIHLYKYNFIEDLGVPLGRIIISALAKNNLPLPDIIVPIPLHKKRLRWRGFNQSEQLAKFIGENLSLGFAIPVSTDLIFREKYTLPQMKIKNYAERKKNLENAFSLKNKIPYEGSAPLKNKTILLIDDVCTTGSTIFECAKILKKAGAKKVFGAVIARQETNQSTKN